MPTEDPGLLIELARFAAMVETAIRSQQELATQWGPKHAMIKAAHRCAKPFNDIIDGMNNPGSPYWHGMLARDAHWGGYSAVAGTARICCFREVYAGQL